MERQRDLVIIGGGPAGLSAACSASRCGLEVALVDEQESPGGQLFRNIESPLGRVMLDAKERRKGLALAEDFRNSGTCYLPGTTVWGIEPGRVSCTRDQKALDLPCTSVIVAPGAMERPVPFPGWTLPGVMGAGAADILLRSGGTFQTAGDPSVVLAGSGPLLLLLASHLIAKGVKIAAWLDTGYASRRLLSAGPAPAALLDAPYLLKGLRMALSILIKKVPVVRGVSDLRAEGDKRVERVSYRVKGKTKTIETAWLIRHEGVIPRTHIPAALGAKLRWDALQRYWYPATDAFGATSMDGVFLAGDACYVHGGDVSIIKGTLSGIAAARRIGVISDTEAEFRAAPFLARLLRLRIARAWLRYVFAPNPKIFHVPDETLVCRCEAVTAGQIRQAVSEGNSDVNEVKRFTRCGMGPCQGRMCGPALGEITAGALEKSPGTVGILRAREPFRPVTLATYCNTKHDA